MNDHIGICIIGAGRAGMIHARNFSHRVEGAYLAAIADPDEDAADAAAVELGTVKAFYDYRRILEDKDIHAVIVASPTRMHKTIVTDCAEAKKHIFCEKPMAMDVNECDLMIAACERNKVKLQIGFMRRYDPSFQRAKNLLDDGEIGALVQINSHTRGPSKPRPWMYDLKASSGTLAEVNSHDIDSVRWFSGSEIQKLFAVGGNYRNREIAKEYPDYYDSVIVNGLTQSGIQFSVNGAAYVLYGYDAGVELVGARGVLRVGRSNSDFVTGLTVDKGISATFITGWADLFKEAYLNEDTAFIRCIMDDKQPEPGGFDGRMAVGAVHAGNHSIKTGETVYA